MKRIGNLYEKIISKENISFAMKEACRTKKNHKNVKKVLEHFNEAVDYIHDNFHISANYVFKTHKDSSSGKERTLTVPPYYPDQVIQHAITRVTEPYIMKKILPECCCSIKGRGMLYASNLVRKALKNRKVRYFVKFDVRKYFPSINHDVLMTQLEKIFKDKKLLDCYREIIYSTEGIPIGNYTSQSLANIYLTPLDRFIKQELKIPYFVRYMDDFVILSSNKRQLQKAIPLIKSFLKDNLLLNTHDDEMVLDVYQTPIDFCGFKHYKSRTTIRKRIWKRARRMILRQLTYLNKRRSKRLMAYYGYIVHSNSFKILQKYFKIITQSRCLLKKA